MGAGLDAFLASEGYIRPPIAHSTKLPDEMEIRETDRGGPGQNGGIQSYAAVYEPPRPATSGVMALPKNGDRRSSSGRHS